jgi:putative photosynthetic complex assembly protein 2
MLHSPWIAALIALFLWWFSTGAILLAVRRADKEGAQARLWAVLWNLPVLILGGVGFFDTLTNDSVAGVYVAFLSALALWGWIELAFLTGSSPARSTSPCPTPPRNGNGSSAPGAPSPITRCCWPSR